MKQSDNVKRVDQIIGEIYESMEMRQEVTPIRKKRRQEYGQTIKLMGGQVTPEYDEDYNHRDSVHRRKNEQRG